MISKENKCSTRQLLTLSVENMDIEDDLAHIQERLGMITVAVQRVTSKKLRRPRAIRPQGLKPLTNLKFPTEIVKDRHIGNATVLVICTGHCRDLGNANDKIAYLELLPNTQVIPK